MGRKYKLRQAQIRQPLHFGQALKRGGAGIGHCTEVGLAGQIADGKAGVVMGRADQAINIDLHGRSGLRGLRRAQGFSPLMSPGAKVGRGASKLAMG